MRSLRRWLALPARTDPVETQLAPIIQIVLLAFIATIALAVILPLIAFGARGFTPTSLAVNGTFALTMVICLVLLRRGRFKTVLVIIIAAMLLAEADSLAITDLNRSTTALLTFVIPITFAGLLIGRRALFIVIALSIALVVWAAARPFQPAGGAPSLSGTVIQFILVIGLMGVLLQVFGRALRRALASSVTLARENEALYRDAESQRQQLQVTLASIGDAVIATDREGRITFINAVAQDLTGWTEPDAVGKPISDIFHIVNERTRETVENPIVKVIREGVVVGLANHTVLISRQGSETPIDDSGAPIRSGQGQIIGVVLVFRDVTERKRAEDRSRLMLELTEALSESLTEEQVAESIIHKGLPILGAYSGTVWTLGADGQTLILRNKRGVDEANLREYPTVRLDYPGPLPDAVRQREMIWLSTAEEYVAHYPHLAEAIRRNDTQASACLPLMLGRSVIGGITISFAEPREATSDDRVLLKALADQCAQALHRARLYENEAQARRAAEEADKLKLRFLGMISHELRTPLTSIKGFSSTLLAPDVTWTPEQELEFVTIMDKEADKLTDLVGQLLDVSSLAAGTLRIQPAPTSVSFILDAADTALTRLSADHTLTIDVPQDLPLVMADGVRIAQVLINLVHNAAKYAPVGTTIGLSARQNGDKVQFSVRDEGPGIPVSEREHVFEAFQQVVQSIRPPGAGLGLAICKGMVEAHGGRIWIEDAEGRGAIISFTVPVAK